METKAILITAIGFLALISICQSLVFAETEYPGIVVAVLADPYYFSEGDFGIGILKYYNAPLDPYLVPGVTTSNSSLQEISKAYSESVKNKNITSTIVSEENRAQAFRVTISGGQFQDKHVISFLNFEHTETFNAPPGTPESYRTAAYGLNLESLPSTDMQWYYDNVIHGYFSTDKKPEPFDIDVEVLTGDGMVIQTWNYYDCDVIDYVSYLDENAAKLKFVGNFVPEITEKTELTCVGFQVDFSLKGSPGKSIKAIDFVPQSNETAKKFLVTFSGGDLEKQKMITTFSDFTPLTQNGKLPILSLGNPVEGSPKFALESLPSKDNQEYYAFLSDYINPGPVPQPFDVSVGLVTEDGVVVQNWKYSKCDATNYITFLSENALLFRFYPGSQAEIRDKTYFECSGLEIDSGKSESKMEVIGMVPSDQDRAQTFVVQFEGPEISPPQTVYSFTKFSPITNDELRILLPNAPFGEKPRFYLESLPDKDKEWFYNFLTLYINTGRIPELFDVSIDVVVGDGTTIQKWNYKDCQLIEYKQYYQDILFIRMFTKTSEPEMRDRTIIECNGLTLDSTSHPPEQSPSKTINSVNFIPAESDRAESFAVTFSGGDIINSTTIASFAKFSPKMQERSVDSEDHKRLNSGGFILESLPSQDKKDYYQFLSRYVNPGSVPQLFDATINIITGGGQILQSWQYADCKLESYKTYLYDTLIFFTYTGRVAVPEIREKSEFECAGFSVNFEVRDDLGDIGIVTKVTDEERAVSYIMHASRGDLASEYTTALISNFESTYRTHFLLQSLPNKYFAGAYGYGGRYVNPGKAPELFDVRVDLIKGDLSTLYSLKYAKCEVTNYSTYLEDNIAHLKFTPSLKYEIRDKTITECNGVQALVNPPDQKIISPVIQRKIGLSSNEFFCNAGFTLLIRPPLDVGICIKDEHAAKALERGWQKVEGAQQKLSDKIQPIIPTDNERAMSFIVYFKGTDIAPPQTVTTFSKFSPIKDEHGLTLEPDNPFLATPNFYLESLPSKDKEWLYQFVSTYINPGKRPDPFDVTVKVIDGDGEPLQTWKYDKCQRTKYELFLDQNALTYKYHNRWQAEIKDRVFFSCSGFKLNHLMSSPLNDLHY